MADFIIYLKSELVDAVYLQQNAFDEHDAATPPERQQAIFGLLEQVVDKELEFDDKGAARRHFLNLTQAFKDWHQTAWDSQPFKAGQEKIVALLAETASHA